MILQYEQTDTCIRFIGICENDNELSGSMYEGNGMPIKLINKYSVVELNYSPENIHNDIMAIILVIIYFPFFKQDINFDFRISDHLKNILQNDFMFYEIINGKYTNRNINIHDCARGNPIEKFVNKSDKQCISYGGGFDSTAVSLLFPDAYLCSYYSNLDDKKELENMMCRLNKTMGLTGFTIQSNIKDIIDKKCFSGYMCSLIPSFLILMDKKIKYIMIGSEIDGQFLCGARRYVPAHLPERKNRWNAFLEKCSIELFSPIGGLSEMANIKICIDNGFIDALYCQKNKGLQCHKCIKCFRKNTGISFILNQHHKPEYWNGYKQEMIENKIKDNLYSRTLAYTLRGNYPKPDYLDKFISQLNHVDESLWCKIYSKSYYLIPEEIRNDMWAILTSKFNVMTPDEDKTIETWNQPRGQPAGHIK